MDLNKISEGGNQIQKQQQQQLQLSNQYRQCKKKDQQTSIHQKSLHELQTKLVCLALIKAKQFDIITQVRPLSLHNLIQNLLEVARCYVNDHVQIPDFASYIVHYYLNKFEKMYQCSHSMYTIIYSWRTHLKDSLQSRLFAFLLQGQKSTKLTIKNFLRIRKEILKTNSYELLDQIHLPHQETITVVHRLYDHTHRNVICKWLNDFYINTSYKQTNNAKLSSCIFIQFLLNCQSHMQNLQKEVKLTDKSERIPNPGLFLSRIDKNNGFSIIKGHVEYGLQPTNRIYSSNNLNKSGSENINKVLFSPLSVKNKQINSITPKKHIPTGQQDRNNQLIHRLFGAASSLKSPSKFTLKNMVNSQDKFFGKAHKQGKYLTSYKKSQQYNKRVENSFQDRNTFREDTSSNLVQKYTQSWEKMIQDNQHFKEKILKQSQSIVDRKRKLYEQNSLEFTHKDVKSKIVIKERQQQPRYLHPKRAKPYDEIKQERNQHDNDHLFSFKEDPAQQARSTRKIKTLFE